MTPLEGLELEIDAATVKPTADWKVPPEIEMCGLQSPWETIWLRMFAWCFLLYGLIYYFMIARRYEIGDVAVTQHILVLTMIASSQLALGFLYHRLSNRIELGPGLRRLKAKLQRENAVATELEISQDNVVTGCDEGFVWVEEGTLYYKGLQTVFRLNKDDVPSTRSWPRNRRPNIDAGRPPRWIPVLVPNRRVTMRLKMIDPFEDNSTRRRVSSFDKELTLWLRDRPEGSLESRLPPLELHPSLRKGTAIRNEGLIAGVFLNVVNAVLLATARYDFSGNDLVSMANALEVGVAILLSWRSIVLARGQWRDVRVRRDLGFEAKATLSSDA